MIGGGLVGAFFLLVLVYGLAILGIGLCIAALICFIRHTNRKAFILLIVGSVLFSPALMVIHKSNELKKTRFYLEAKVPLDTSSFSLHPKVYRDELGGFQRQMVWGEVDLDVRLPNGGVIRGSCDRISIGSSNEGKFHSLQVFYEPDMTFYHATSVNDVFNYWKEQGTVVWDHPGSLRVDCGDYILNIGEIGGYVTLTATNDK